MSLTEPRAVFKPFEYDWAYTYWKQQQQSHWLPDEVPMAEDVKDWENNLTPAQKNLLTQIFRFFTQGDVEVNNCYMKTYSQMFGPPEIQMMLSAFSNIETVHIDAYSHLIDTLGMPETEYSAFLENESMRAKYDFLNGVKVETKADIARTLAIFSGFTEGMSLFASFAILMNFPRQNLMKGMGQIVTWSIRDESLHCEGMTKVFRTFIEENREVWNDELKASIYQACRDMVKLEDNFIDSAYELGPVDGLTKEEVKQYIRYIADRRLVGLGLKPNFEVSENPLPWLEELLNGSEYGNFFETRTTEYSKSSLTGKWDDAYASPDVYIVYGQPDCGFCEKAKGLLTSCGLDFAFVELSDEAKAKMYASSGRSSIPIIHRNGEEVGGYQDLRRSLLGGH